MTSWSSLQNTFKTAVHYSPTQSIQIVVTSAGLRGESVLPHIFPKDLVDDEDLPKPPTATMDVMLTGSYYTTVLALHYFGKFHKASESAKKVATTTADREAAGNNQATITNDKAITENGADGHNAQNINVNCHGVKEDEIAIHNNNGNESLEEILEVANPGNNNVDGDEPLIHRANSVTAPSISSDDINAYQLVYIASLSSYRGFASMSTYNAAKYGVRGLWKSIRNAPHGTYPFALRTNLVAPTITRTNMTADYFDAFIAAGGVATEVSDVVDVTMRMICDETVDGRAVCALPDGKSFDLADDPRGGDGGKVVWEVSRKDGLGGKKIKAMTGYYEWFPEDEEKV